MENAGCVEGPADHRPVAVDRLRQAGSASEVGQRLHASVGVPNESPRAEEVVSERESDDRAILVNTVGQRRGKTGERAEKSELVIGAPADGCRSIVGLIPTGGNTGVVDRARLTGERVVWDGERLHSVGVVGAGG